MLADLLREYGAKFNSVRAVASKDAREEVREMRTRMLPLIASIQADMLVGHVPINAEWNKIAADFMDRAGDKSAQVIDLTQRITTVEVRQPCQ